MQPTDSTTRTTAESQPGDGAPVASGASATGQAVLALVALGGIAWFVASIVALHVLRPDVAPLAQGISHYANGPWGVLFDIADVALGVGGLALTVGLWRGLAPTARSPVGLLLLGVWSLATVASGLFPIDAPGAPPSLAGAVHGAAGLNFLCLVAAALLVARRLPADARWAPIARPALVGALAILVTAVALYLLIEPLRSLGLGGLAQRAYWAAALAWLALIAARLWVVATAAGQAAIAVVSPPAP
jgi:hypothetical protein